MGFADHNTWEQDVGEFTKPLLSFTIHPGYDPYTLANDIAVIHFSSIESFDSTKYPACKPDNLNSYAGSQSVVSGWGTTSEGTSVKNY